MRTSQNEGFISKPGLYFLILIFVYIWNSLQKCFQTQPEEDYDKEAKQEFDLVSPIDHRYARLELEVEEFADFIESQY